MRTALLFTACLGLAISVVLARMSLPSAEAGVSSGTALCKPTVHVNCDYVLASRWAKLGPIPSAFVGMAYFASLVVWFVFVGLPNRAGRKWHRVPVAVCLAGMVYSIWLIWVMAVELPYWCTWCLAGHVVNGVLVILVLWTGRRINSQSRVVEAEPAHPSAARGWSVIVGCIGILLVTVQTGVAIQLQRTTRQFQLAHLDAVNNIDYGLWRYAQSPVQEILVDPRDFVIGPSGAKNVVVAYSDFECGNCYGFHRYAGRLIALFPEDVRIAFKHYPLCRDCNPHVPRTIHYFACDAARAAEAAYRTTDVNRAYRFGSAIYERGRRLDLRPYEQFARELGMDVDAWRTAMHAESTLQKIREDVKSAYRLGVEGTPVIFLNGRRVEAWRLVTRDPSPQVDVAATDKLWEKLLGVHPARSGDPSIE